MIGLPKRTAAEEHSMARWSVMAFLKQRGPQTFRELGSTGLCEIRLQRALAELVTRGAVTRDGKRYAILNPDVWVL